MRIICKDLKDKCPNCGRQLMAINNVLLYYWSIDCAHCGEIEKGLSINEISQRYEIED